MARIAPAIGAAAIAVIAAALAGLSSGLLALVLAGLGLLRGALGRLAIIASLATSFTFLALPGAIGWIIVVVALGSVWLVAGRLGAWKFPVGPLIVVLGAAVVIATTIFWAPLLGAYGRSDATIRALIMLSALGAFIATASITSWQNRGA